MKKERIVYKVVDYDYKSVSMRSPTYRKTYKKGKIVKAKKNTFGIFCFDNLTDAIRFMGRNNKILQVRPIGKGRKIKIRSTVSYASQISKFYKEYWKIFGRIFSGKKFREKLSKCKICDSSKIFYTPKGTICYDAVEVLNEINFHGDIIK